MEKFQWNVQWNPKPEMKEKFQNTFSRFCEHKLKNFSGRNVFNCNLWALAKRRKVHNVETRPSNEQWNWKWNGKENRTNPHVDERKNIAGLSTNNDDNKQYS